MTNVVAILSDPETARTCLDAAATAAAAVPGGKVEAFHARVKPESLIMVTEEVMTDERRAELVARLDRRSRILHEIVGRWITDHKMINAPRWHEVNGDRVESIVAARGKTADLVVIVRPDESEGKDALQAAMFETNRLLLLVPPIARAALSFGRHIAIAWKASDQAARAVTISIPWLRQAERVSLLSVSEGDGVAAFDELIRLLDPRGIKAEPVLVGLDEQSVGARLLRAVHEIGADCLVMGAYRHNRVIEFILGGVTRYMRQQADVPLFMLH